VTELISEVQGLILEHVRLFVWVGVWSNRGGVGGGREKGLRWLGFEERDDIRLALLSIPVSSPSTHISTFIPPFSSSFFSRFLLQYPPSLPQNFTLHHSVCNKEDLVRMSSVVTAYVSRPNAQAVF